MAINEAYCMAIKALGEIQQYRSIGTGEECQETKNKQIPKQPKNKVELVDFYQEVYTYRGDCPVCGGKKGCCQRVEGIAPFADRRWIGRRKKKMEKLTRRSENGTGVYNTPSGDPVRWEDNRHKVLQKLADYEDLEEQGRLLRLPCVVGDAVFTNISMKGWYLRKKDRPYKAEVVFIGINRETGYINVAFENGHMYQFSFSDIGKIVFLTQEEAEAALEINESIHIRCDSRKQRRYCKKKV